MCGNIVLLPKPFTLDTGPVHHFPYLLPEYFIGLTGMTLRRSTSFGLAQHGCNLRSLPWVELPPVGAKKPEVKTSRSRYYRPNCPTEVQGYKARILGHFAPFPPHGIKYTFHSMPLFPLNFNCFSNIGRTTAVIKCGPNRQTVWWRSRYVSNFKQFPPARTLGESTTQV